MGSSASIQTVEVSFIDPVTGNMLSDNEIDKLSKEAEAFVDFSNKFYEAFNNPSIYARLAEEWKRNNSNIVVSYDN
jgi:hypothetical protein